MWSPLKNKAYAVLFVATVISNIGTWMHEVGASWKMTQMTQDPTMVALIQTAVSLPIFFFALPAGAIADLFNRKSLLLTINVIALGLVGALAILMQLDSVTPHVLLLCTFLLGMCAAFIAPAWQAIVPGLVPKSALSSAVSLNGVGINISRAIGPALARCTHRVFWYSISVLGQLLKLCGDNSRTLLVETNRPTSIRFTQRAYTASNDFRAKIR